MYYMVLNLHYKKCTCNYKDIFYIEFSQVLLN